MKKHVDADGTKGFIFVSDQEAGKVKRAVQKNDNGTLSIVEGASVWLSRWAGLNLDRHVAQANTM